MTRYAPSFMLLPILPICLVLTANPAAGETESPTTDQTQLRVETAEEGAGWQIFRGDQVLAGYRAASAGKPIVYPLNTPSGTRVVRDYPIQEAGPNEKQDHPHHRSLWLTHGEVNGIDFWSTSEERAGGTIRQTAGKAETDDDGSVVIQTENVWSAPDGTPVLTDRQRYTFRVDGDRTVVDCDYRLIASEGDVHFGDTKEGSFGIRVAGSMKVDAGLGGQITNDAGEHDKEAWGKRSRWVDYSGPVIHRDASAAKFDEQSLRDSTAGITIHYHPSSHGAPCRWHVRDYGLFAANPFGVHHFVGGPKTDGFTLPEGKSLDMYLRVVVHDGPFTVSRTEADAKAYAMEEIIPPGNE